MLYNVRVQKPVSCESISAVVWNCHKVAPGFYWKAWQRKKMSSATSISDRIPFILKCSFSLNKQNTKYHFNHHISDQKNLSMSTTAFFSANENNFPMFCWDSEHSDGNKSWLRQQQMKLSVFCTVFLPSSRLWSHVWVVTERIRFLTHSARDVIPPLYWWPCSIVYEKASRKVRWLQYRTVVPPNKQRVVQAVEARPQSVQGYCTFGDY